VSAIFHVKPNALHFQKTKTTMVRVGAYNANFMGPVFTHANKGTAAAIFKTIQLIN
jgi:hypothetical protein